MVLSDGCLISNSDCRFPLTFYAFEVQHMNARDRLTTALWSALPGAISADLLNMIGSFLMPRPFSALMSKLSKYGGELSGKMTFTLQRPVSFGEIRFGLDGSSSCRFIPDRNVVDGSYSHKANRRSPSTFGKRAHFDPSLVWSSEIRGRRDRQVII